MDKGSLLGRNRDHLLQALLEITSTVEQQLADVSLEIAARLSSGRTIFWCGNGGSAAESQHMAAELMGRFLIERKPISSLSLTTDTSGITAIGNDFSFDEIFERQIQGLGKEDDILIIFSTSGESKNVIRAVKAAHEIGILTIGFLGNRNSTLADLVSQKFVVEIGITARIQEVHTLLAHTMCELIEANLYG
jgi:D-sedoheptulose 7-phosphate isomerase